MVCGSFMNGRRVALKSKSKWMQILAGVQFSDLSLTREYSPSFASVSVYFLGWSLMNRITCLSVSSSLNFANIFHRFKSRNELETTVDSQSYVPCLKMGRAMINCLQPWWACDCTELYAKLTVKPIECSETSAASIATRW